MPLSCIAVCTVSQLKLSARWRNETWLEGFLMDDEWTFRSTHCTFGGCNNSCNYLKLTETWLISNRNSSSLMKPSIGGCNETCALSLSESYDSRLAPRGPSVFLLSPSGFRIVHQITDDSFCVYSQTHRSAPNFCLTDAIWVLKSPFSPWHNPPGQTH